MHQMMGSWSPIPGLATAASSYTFIIRQIAVWPDGLQISSMDYAWARGECRFKSRTLTAGYPERGGIAEPALLPDAL